MWFSNKSIIFLNTLTKIFRNQRKLFKQEIIQYDCHLDFMIKIKANSLTIQHIIQTYQYMIQKHLIKTTDGIKFKCIQLYCNSTELKEYILVIS